MLFELFFLIEIILLFFLSNLVTSKVSSLIFHHTRNKSFTITLLAIIFLPGTFIHELSHFLASILLFVPVHGISLRPKFEDSRIKLGSVSIQRTDPIRRFLIGASPIFFGISIIIYSFYLFSINKFDNQIWGVLPLIFISFEIGNTMFSSKKDMEGAWVLLIFITIIIGLIYLLGLRIPISNIENILSQNVITSIFEKLDYYLLFPILVDIFLIMLLKILKRLYTNS